MEENKVYEENEEFNETTEEARSKSSGWKTVGKLLVVAGGAAAGAFAWHRHRKKNKTDESEDVEVLDADAIEVVEEETEVDESEE